MRLIHLFENNSSTDEQYMLAVNDNDMATAQKMVNHAAKKAGYNKDVQHQTNEKFNEFTAGEFGFHVGTNIPSGMLGNTMNLKAKIKKPFRMKDLGVWTPNEVVSAMWNANILSDDELSDLRTYIEVLQDQLSGRLNNDEDIIDNRKAHYQFSAAVRNALKEHNYDSIVYKNEAEGFDDSFIILFPEQLKLADPVTHDDQKNVIPLSQRFNSKNKDIRY